MKPRAREPLGTRIGRALMPTGPWHWVSVLIMGSVAYGILFAGQLATNNDNYLPALLLFGALVPPGTVLAYAYGRVGGVTPSIIVLVIIWSGVIGTVIAGIAEHSIATVNGAVSPAAVAIVEEPAKLVVPGIVALLLWRRTRYGGVVIGIATGMGFGFLETMGYALNIGDTQHQMDVLLLDRGLLAPARHVAWTGITVAMIWRIPAAQNRVLAVTLASLTFVGAVLLHTVWDADLPLLVDIIGIVAGAAAVFWIIWADGRTRDRNQEDRGQDPPTSA
jgi:RsiW-degrading membrane proteinase PrsW (M82 family)